ncbi:nicotinamide/nicotinic acid mononucleotide adenylyltransferase 3 isoform X1 [Anabrus simplex]|uniref:nicotinamide/nicotinic acid mononucleotide adenylyltransferase 3 isoform X1 n=1 Tax=Anabrus simplex TaxID=316456 RepID=UPI0035A3168A
MAPTKVVLLSCGAFNPPTIMHLRMFEIARDHLQRMEYHKVIGGVISPVHDEYGKKDLVSSTHRCAMLRHALRSSDWIRLSSWECQQESWSRTRVVLAYHQNQINAVLNDNLDSPNKKQRREELHWVPDDVKYHSEGSVRVKLLCGADLLESFGTPGLWSEEDIDTIVGQHGLVVITREGTNPYKFIYESDLLTKYQNNITIVTEWISNEVSSTKIRRALRRSESVKYLLEEPVIDYIMKEGLYGTKDNVDWWNSLWNILLNQIIINMEMKINYDSALSCWLNGLPQSPQQDYF